MLVALKQEHEGAAPAAAEVDDDHALMRRFRSGDAGAFETLYERHRIPIFNFCVRMLGSRDAAADAMQEIFAKVIRSAARWRPEAKFTTWLYTIARNHIFDLGRKKRTRRDAMVGVTADDASPPPSTDPSLRRALERAIASLPNEQREVFLLRAYSGLSFKEVGAIAECPVNTAKSRMRLATVALKKHLTEAGVVPETDD